MPLRTQFRLGKIGLLLVVVGRIFCGAHEEIFPKFFLRGGKNGEICFFPLETTKTTFFAEIFKIQGGSQGPHVPLPTPVLVDKR